MLWMKRRVSSAKVRDFHHIRPISDLQSSFLSHLSTVFTNFASQNDNLLAAYDIDALLGGGEADTGGGIDLGRGSLTLDGIEGGDDGARGEHDAEGGSRCCRREERLVSGEGHRGIHPVEAEFVLTVGEHVVAGSAVVGLRGSDIDTVELVAGGRRRSGGICHDQRHLAAAFGTEQDGFALWEDIAIEDLQADDVAIDNTRVGHHARGQGVGFKSAVEGGVVVPAVVGVFVGMEHGGGSAEEVGHARDAEEGIGGGSIMDRKVHRTTILTEGDVRAQKRVLRLDGGIVALEVDAEGIVIRLLRHAAC